MKYIAITTGLDGEYEITYFDTLQEAVEFALMNSGNRQFTIAKEVGCKIKVDEIITN